MTASWGAPLVLGDLGLCGMGNVIEAKKLFDKNCSKLNIPIEIKTNIFYMTPVFGI